MTVLLIVVNMLVFWGPQRAEEKAEERAAGFYAKSSLPKIELPAFVAWLDETRSPRARAAKRLLARGDVGNLLGALQREKSFLARLRADQVITPADPRHAGWKNDRRQYEAMLPAPFTERWSQDHNQGAEFKPETWITSAFLHGSNSHLLGNMLFLFLFGFSVELALGRTLYLAFYLLGAIGASALAAWAYAGNGGYGLGASGAVSALMAMYAVMYRLRRIRFFYQLFFYFNYVTAPALILLPAWIVNELLQHFIGGQGIAYMAHLGGLLTGAMLMAAVMRWRTPRLEEAPPVQAPDAFAQHVANARRLSSEMKFEPACTEWRAAASLRPGHAETLRAWFNTAKLWPAGEDFHRAARAIFRLSPQDPATLEFQHTAYKAYLDHARPGARLRPEDMARLARRFTRAKQFADAQRLCQALLRTAPDHPELPDTLSLCANGLLQAGRREQALDWLPELLRLAPDDMVTRALQKA